MSLASWLVARLVGLPPAHTPRVTVERDLRAHMPDGVTLLADRYVAQGGERAPIVLMRSPYGRRALFGLIGRIFAERGYQAVVQSVRGTFGSGGEFVPLRQEAEDGRATLAWLEKQPWFGGRVGMTGPSYLGFVQWAIATDSPEYLRALAPQITASQFRDSLYGGGSFALKTLLAWAYLLQYQERPARELMWSNLRMGRTLARAATRTPLKDTDAAAVGQRVQFFQEWLAHNEPGDPYWEAMDHSKRVDTVTAPVNLLGGWYDIFLPEQVADYVALRRAGRQPHLTVGPWRHTSLGVIGASLRESLAWFDEHLRDEPAQLSTAPVRVFMLGEKRWRELPDWPPQATSTRWRLQPGGGLAPTPAADSAPDHYRYDPSDPTPSVGGAILTNDAGPHDNRRLEARADVLTYTSAPLADDLEVIGPVAAELYVQSSVEHTDFFVRLCDVAPGGSSINICDGLTRLWPGRATQGADGVLRVRVEMWPTACRFRKGHRLRVQVSSGAHPRYSRNLGDGEPLATATTMVVAEQRVWHDAGHPSAIILPIVTAPEG